MQAKQRKPNRRSEIQPLLRAPNAMPTGSATEIHAGSISVSALFQFLPRKWTGTQTIRP